MGGVSMGVSIFFFLGCFNPICSMYGIYTYIWVFFRVNVGKYTIHGAAGNGKEVSGEMWNLTGGFPDPDLIGVKSCQRHSLHAMKDCWLKSLWSKKILMFLRIMIDPHFLVKFTGHFFCLCFCFRPNPDLGSFNSEFLSVTVPLLKPRTCLIFLWDFRIHKGCHGDCLFVFPHLPQEISMK